MPANYDEPGPKIKEAAFFFASPQSRDVLRFSHMALQVLDKLAALDSARLGFDVSHTQAQAQACSRYARFFLGLQPT